MLHHVLSIVACTTTITPYNKHTLHSKYTEVHYNQAQNQKNKGIDTGN